LKHLGDITRLKGSEVPIVDIVCGGSPCQDLSVAGKRAGLDGARSGLFMEQIRIVKEMRENDRTLGRANEHIRPRYMVWENVAGALSSPGIKNGKDMRGEDFRVVLEETAKIADENAIIPRPSGGAKWSASGCIMGDGWSIAWRVHDAQFWGVPQQRKRIALVADFGGQSAPEILFERKGLSRDIEESAKQREGTTKNIGASIAETISFQERAGCDGGAKESSYNTSEQEHCQPSTTKVYCLQGNGIDRAETAGCNGKGWREDESYTLNTIDRHAVCCSQDAYDKFTENDKSASLKAMGGTYGGGQRSISDTVGALCARDYKGVGNQYVNEGKCIVQRIE